MGDAGNRMREEEGEENVGGKEEKMKEGCVREREKYKNR